MFVKFVAAVFFIVFAVLRISKFRVICALMIFLTPVAYAVLLLFAGDSAPDHLLMLNAFSKLVVHTGIAIIISSSTTKLSGERSVRVNKEKITDGTLFLSCLMTYAQIEKLRARKVRFSEID